MDEYEQQLHPLKHLLFRQLLASLPAGQPGNSNSGSSSLLEVGIGTAPNLPYYTSSSKSSPSQLSVTGLEPNTAMWGYAQEKAAAAGWAQQQLQLVEGDAQQMPFADSSFDAAVMTLVLCSVPQPQAVLSELLRVLQPGGQLLLIEHVIAPQPGLLQLQQRLLDPLQRLLADNCHLTRDTAAALSSTGFVPQPLPPLPVQYGTVTAIDVGDSSRSSSSSSAVPEAAGSSGDYWRFEVEGMGLIAPHIAGILQKPLQQQTV